MGDHNAAAGPGASTSPDAGVSAALISLGRLIIELDVSLGDTDSHAAGHGGPGFSGVMLLVLLDSSGPVRPSTIVKLTSMSSAGVTQFVDRLAHDGYVTRSQHRPDEDRRAVFVEISPTGRTALTEADAAVRESSRELLAALLSLQAHAPTADQPPAQPVAAPALTALFTLINGLDTAIARVMGEGQTLDITDPRPFLLLLELAHARRAGQPGLPLADISATIHRSRATTHRLLRKLEAIGVTRRGRVRTAAGTIMAVQLTEQGAGFVAVLVESITERLPALAPHINELIAALRPEAS